MALHIVYIYIYTTHLTRASSTTILSSASPTRCACATAAPCAARAASLASCSPRASCIVSPRDVMSSYAERAGSPLVAYKKVKISTGYTHTHTTAEQTTHTTLEHRATAQRRVIVEVIQKKVVSHASRRRAPARDVMSS